ncbi:Uridylate kinase isoform B [Sphaceloma murrayae]|uniref:Uridylate kinase isoform B n=1 Tax=Sphaceloma murrayae TaxID=2082308 RepID=A0A2K1QI98_9PEZI|nr:Uridylate kinase isoform B [Sphaceloma murrayae]
MSPNCDQDFLIFVIGAPGSGKGTLCSRLALENDFVHLSVGDLLRQASSAGSEVLDQTVVECVRKAELIPAKTLAKVLATHVGRGKENRQCRFIVDGFPRDIDQIKAVEDIIGKPKLVLFFDCPKAEANQRYLTRNIEGRDDTSDLFEKRYSEFEEKNGPIVEHYRKEGALIKIDTSGVSDVSFNQLNQALRQRDEWEDIYWRPQPW